MEKDPQEEANQRLIDELLEMGFSESQIASAMKIHSTKENILNHLLAGNHQNQPQSINEDDGFESEEEDYKMLFLVRMDLKMSLGKIAQLVATSALRAYKQIEALIDVDQFKEVAFFQWNQNGQKKIVLKCNSEKELLDVLDKIKDKNINSYILRELESKLKDETLAVKPDKKQKLNKMKPKPNEPNENLKSTENSHEIKDIEENKESQEVVVLMAVGPVSESEIDPLTKHLKLY